MKFDEKIGIEETEVYQDGEGLQFLIAELRSQIPESDKVKIEDFPTEELNEFFDSL